MVIPTPYMKLQSHSSRYMAKTQRPILKQTPELNISTPHLRQNVEGTLEMKDFRGAIPVQEELSLSMSDTFVSFVTQ